LADQWSNAATDQFQEIDAPDGRLDNQIVSASLQDIGGGLAASLDEVAWIETSDPQPGVTCPL
jgi:hypothetical protein